MAKKLELDIDNMKNIIKDILKQGLNLTILNRCITEALVEIGCCQTIRLIYEDDNKSQNCDMNEKIEADIYRMKEFIIDIVRQESNLVVLGGSIIKILDEAGISCTFMLVNAGNTGTVDNC